MMQDVLQAGYKSLLSFYMFIVDCQFRFPACYASDRILVVTHSSDVVLEYLSK